MSDEATSTTAASGSPFERLVRPNRVQNDTGDTMCIVRYMVDTEAGWLGAWDEAAFGAYVAAAVAAERERCADDLRCALEALDYCIDDSAELLNERAAQWGEYRKDRQAAMAATLERHRAVAERLRRALNGPN